ncbi:alpha-amylase family protein [Rhodospirillaceae bacterium SYSU D60014]|uniref:alpha-amylase family protein n=1 Tax=Virgifigura deserti TaxID=2268457 RepID=UPI000E669504
MDEPWYKNAVFYAVDVALFQDSNGDGIGDFKGLTSRVPYLADLGVTCVWILPSYPSLGRDNGYDVTDYYQIRPQLGTLDDFLEFLHKAGEHGIRVILDLVVDHTSDKHPWFEAARRDEQSRYRDYYIWSHDPPPPPPGQGTIFPGQESSVWSYDDVARAFYYHRFYSFEPGLNVANPDVQDEICRIIDYWLSFGISGFRVDAALHMVEPKLLDSTEAEDPHGILRRFHDFATSRRPNALLLGEVDENPDILEATFGSGNQLDMLFNFYLNNDIFLALAREDSGPVIKALQVLPEPPKTAQWANFLRNLDELDLERLSDEERDEVFKVFAPEDGMRIFGRGIRRRLAPMLNGDQRRIELAFSLLFSLPGAPLFVYGDEIGMGEDLAREGRDAVRTAMQWSDQANAGFSTAAADKLTAPVIDRGDFAYRQVNVANQLESPDSLLSKVRSFIRLRREHHAIGSAAFRLEDTAESSILGHSYKSGKASLILLHNLRGAERKAQIDIVQAEGGRLRDLLSGEEQRLERRTQTVRMEPYGYRWLLATPD